MQPKRDERGWRVPRPGTVSRKIYELLLQGLKPRQIMLQLEKGDVSNRNSLGVLIWKIKHPDPQEATKHDNNA